MWRAAMMVMAALLCGCSLPRMIDSDVQSFPTPLAPASGSTYRFERLPSQEAFASQDRIEALANEAFTRRGLRQGGPDATFTVQVQVSVSQIANPRNIRPRASGFWILGGGVESRAGTGLLLSVEDAPWLRHSVQLVIRQASTARVVYETQATFDGPWGDTLRLLPPMLEAAMDGYPAPPSGPRKVVIELPATQETR